MAANVRQILMPRFLVSENLILDIKIMSLHAPEPKIEHFFTFIGGHFEIQDGRQFFDILEH